MKALGVTGRERSDRLPDIPTIDKAGVPGYTATIWLGLMAPTGTPKNVVDRLNAEITKITSRPDVKKIWLEQGAVPLTMSVGEFDQYLKADIAKWAKIVKISGARPDQ